MHKAILVPIDLSHAEKGKAAIEVAKKFGEEGTRIMLINVVADVPTYVVAEILGDIIEKSKEKAHSVLETMAKAAGV